VEVIVRVNDELTADESASLVLELTLPIAISYNAYDAMHISQTLTKTYGDESRRRLLRMNFELECSENFYSENCAVFCQERDDDFAHLACDSSGNIVCMEGFTDLTTNCTQCVLAQGCCESLII